MTRIFSMFRHVAIAMATTALLTLAVPGTGQAADFTDGQLKSYAMAWTSINQLAEQWKSQMEATPSEEEREKMLEQFEVATNQVIERTEGIGATEFAGIMEAAQSDPALSQRISEMLQEAQPQ